MWRDSQSAALLDFGTASTPHAYWLSDADEMWHFSMHKNQDNSVGAIKLLKFKKKTEYMNMQSLNAGHKISKYQDVRCLLDQNRLPNYLRWHKSFL